MADPTRISTSSCVCDSKTGFFAAAGCVPLVGTCASMYLLNSVNQTIKVFKQSSEGLWDGQREVGMQLCVVTLTNSAMTVAIFAAYFFYDLREGRALFLVTMSPSILALLGGLLWDDLDDATVRRTMLDGTLSKRSSFMNLARMIERVFHDRKGL